MRVPFSLFLLFYCFIFSAQPIHIIPQPVEVKQQSGSYTLKNKITVSNSFPSADWARLFRYFREEMKKQFNISVTEAPKNKKGDIDFFMTRMPTSGKPAYQLAVDRGGVSIKCNFAEPAFHAMQTLFQLLPADPAAKKEIPFVGIFDHARFGYRGVHLDVARHFFPVSFIKRYIDYLAYYKFNKFHWHLTDDQGWRIELKKYPQLTETGGWRNGTIIGRYPGTGNDGIRYGGFYTKEQIKEVVNYATDRYITVIPEIEMPGHSSAAIAAYPWLSCFPDQQTAYPEKCAWNGPTAGKQVQQTWGVFDDVFCAGKESTFEFLEGVMDEVLELFPSKYIHVGGDESPKTHWKKCPACQKRIAENKLKDEHELQSYFIQRMEKYLNKKGRILIGWDEILEGGLAPNAVVMSWRGEKGGIDAAKQDHDVIMTPGNPVYFDHSQSENEDSVTIGGYNPIENVYAYEPVPGELNEEQARHILGAQANLWTEYIKNTKKVEYMLFPRISALSEVLWSPKEKRNWTDFEKRLLVQLNRYDRMKINYSKAYFDLTKIILPAANKDGLLLVLKSKAKGNYFYGRLLNPQLPGLVNNPKPVLMNDSLVIEIRETGQYAGLLYNGPDIRTAKVIMPFSQHFYFNKATGKKITLKNPADPKYPGDGAFTLVNGVQNKKGLANAKEFLGFSGKDCEAIIDLGKEESINSIKIHVLDQQSSWIYLPARTEIFYSSDGENFSSAPAAEAGKVGNVIEWSFNPAFKTRYLKVLIRNFGVIPAGNPGAGNKSWLFVDEIEIN